MSAPHEGSGGGPSVPGRGPARRRLLALATGAGAAAALGGAAGCGAPRAGDGISGELLRSTAPLPEPFQVPLPVPPVAEPVRTRGGAAVYEVEQRAARLEILPGLKTEVWGYDGRFPGPTFVGESERELRLRVRNALEMPTSTHLHGGVQRPESDGHPTDLVLPSGFPDPRHPEEAGKGEYSGSKMVKPSEWTISRGHKEYVYPLKQRATTLWYHDHRMDFSAPQVWRGLAGMFLVHDDEESGLPLPEDSRDIPLMICDRAFEEDGSFRYPSLDPSLAGKPGVREQYMEGVTGDVVLVNGVPWPELEVSAERYRFRILNASNARRFRLALDPGPREGAAFVQVGSDGGLLGAPREHEELPVSPAERFDVVIDFAAFPMGSEVRLVNTLGHGRTRDVMRFRVTRRAKRGAGAPRVPRRLADVQRLKAGQAVVDRQFDFRQKQVHGMRMWTVNGKPYDPGSPLASPRLDTVERWRFTSDFHHPVHVHLAHFQVLSRSGKTPLDSDAGWKDTVDVRPFEVVDVLIRFAGYRGMYMLHCHNLEHEDMAMMADFRIV
ncbi:multicopper oxidase family protein [Streptomyces qinglanensis]|uniref:Multicopper oxidase CueO n=1 Tax=Streptomyces qinglanensis TaxID=943816 RepID=A0A1H9N8B3_9ACTN|nr:multicopper oxidase family protein [Streptomyces qinglanensis]SER32051.1 Multicopper oxidase with three cupredoxin domains (includes cell division protein FtsP and spore coat protein CotA) [Streptomyces qinglanensis]